MSGEEIEVFNLAASNFNQNKCYSFADWTRVEFVRDINNEINPRYYTTNKLTYLGNYIGSEGNRFTRRKFKDLNTNKETSILLTPNSGFVEVPCEPPPGTEMPPEPPTPTPNNNSNPDCFGSACTMSGGKLKKSKKNTRKSKKNTRKSKKSTKNRRRPKRSR
jgi:hypothetical protein